MIIKPKLSSQEIAINELLEKKGYIFNIFYLGFHHSKNMDEWLYEISNKNNSKCERFSFYTGTGHRFIRKSNTKYPYPCYTVKHLTPSCKKALINYQRKTNSFFAQMIVMNPEKASLLNSLELDSQADETSFSNWCDDFGYDSDSMTAFNVYQDCCKLAKKYHHCINSDTRKEIKTLLEDY